MIDIHSHVIFGVDDGPESMEESLKMLYEAEEIGIKTIIATPHLDSDFPDSKKPFEHLKKLIDHAGDCEIKLKLGFETMLSPILPAIVRQRNFLTLNNSGFLLVEFPFSGVPAYSHEVMYRLQLENITPVIAHPERNRSFIRKPGLLSEFRERGCLLQIDSASIIGYFGERTKHFSKKLLSMDMADFISSDAHSPGHYTDWHLKAYRKVVDWTGEENAEKLFGKNAEFILNKEEKNTCNLF